MSLDFSPAPGAASPEALQAKFIRGLADPVRLSIVQYLLAAPQSVSAIMAHLHMPQSRVSNHLACLKWCGYVTTERQGRRVIYSVIDERLRNVVDLIGQIVADHAERIAACARIADA